MMSIRMNFGTFERMTAGITKLSELESAIKDIIDTAKKEGLKC